MRRFLGSRFLASRFLASAHVAGARWTLVILTALTLSPVVRGAEEEAGAETRTIEVARGRMRLTAPENWQRRKPATRIVEHEFAAPAAEGDKAEARITVMGAGGGVQANIDRWIDQFVQPDGSASKDKAQIAKKKIGDVEVHTVSIDGTYKDRPGGGPFTNTPVVLREDYRMLSAILVTEKMGQYFFKMYGPKKTVDAQEQAFQQMLDSLEVK